MVQEIGTEAPATMFWGDAEIDWIVLHRVCEKLTDYHHFRTKFNIRTSDIKYFFQRFVEPDARSHHANRFSFLYELHRARGLKFTDERDRVFAFLGHYALRSSYYPNSEPAAITADYTKTVEQVYTDIAKWELRGNLGNSTLTALAAVQHMTLPSRHVGENQIAIETPGSDKNRLPFWAPDWRTYQGFILSEPINPHQAHGLSKPKLEIGEDDLILRIHGLEVDTVEACSRPLVLQEFHSKRDHEGSELPIEYLWHEICQKDRFNLSDDYVDGQKAFFAFMQTLSNGCVQIAGREGKPYAEISESRWLELAALYLVRAIGTSGAITPELLAIAEKAERGHEKEEWSRLANGASKNRKFARTKKGYYVLGPAVMEVDDIVCVLFGGKMPFCLRQLEGHYMLVGECSVHGLMKGEAIDMMARNELTEKVFELV